MNITTFDGKILEQPADIVFFGVWQGMQNLAGAAKAADSLLGGVLTDAMVDEDFAGKPGETVVVHTHGKLSAKRVGVVGLRDKKALTEENIREAAGAAMNCAAKLDAKRIAAEVFGGAAYAGAFAEGAYLADYVFLRYKRAEDRKRKKRGMVELALAVAGAAEARGVEKKIKLAEVMSRAAVYARDLVNEPANQMTPAHLVEHAREIAKHNTAISLKVFDRAACEAMGMGAFLAVARGSDQEPYFIHLTYRPGSGGKKIAIVGKGVTFDSGGLSLKPSQYMRMMKSDMAGAAAILGAFSVLADLEPPAEIHGLVAACENMPSGKSYRIDDILTAMNGKTIEIYNTDAEGRLTLADAMSYAAKKIKPDAMVDIATLTGACEVALGEEMSGLMTEDRKLADKLLAAAAKAGEPMWRLPLYHCYADRIRGEQADLRDVPTSRYGEELVAGFFLKEFSNGIPWAHIDMGGSAFVPYVTRSYTPKGATGFGPRTLLHWLMNA